VNSRNHGNRSKPHNKAYGLVTPLVDDLIGLAMSLGAEPATIEQLTARAKFDVLRERIPSAATQIIEGVEAVSQIVRSLKTFAHPGGDEPEAVDLAQVLDSTVTVSRNEWKYVAEIETDIEPGLPPAMGIAGMLNQVFLNLVVNAAHAIADQREATGAAELGRITLTCHSTPEAVVTSVTDTGSGIPPGIQHKIYDQFFTTKRIGTGTGQGLAICRNIIAEHDGTISFTTSTSGTTFTVSLPLWPGEEG
jgi:signal transduction histidine kinase